MASPKYGITFSTIKFWQKQGYETLSYTGRVHGIWMFTQNLLDLQGEDARLIGHMAIAAAFATPLTLRKALREGVR